MYLKIKVIIVVNSPIGNGWAFFVNIWVCGGNGSHDSFKHYCSKSVRVRISPGLQKNKIMKRKCYICKTGKPDKGRAMDGRRAYRCVNCGAIWTEGMQGRKKKFHKQRESVQFKD